MRIDKEKVVAEFQSYVANYNDKDEKVKLKIEHTYRVSSLCEKIALEIGLDKEETELAWLTGMLHDIGRFEQLRNFGTFQDAVSIDHAKYGADILFQDELIRKYCMDSTEDSLIENVIRCHSAFEIPEDYDERTKMFSKILRDADKIDILRVNIETPLEEIYNVTTDELRNCEVSKEVLASFYEHKTVLRSLKKTAADHVVGHVSLIYGLEFPISNKIVIEQGYLEKLLRFQSNNANTRETFRKMKMELERYYQELMK